MPALFEFLFKVNIALLLFCMGYYLVLRHLTFYTLNRIYLVAAILFSSIYPWINISGFIQRHRQLTAPMQNAILQWRAPAENLVKPLNQPNYWLWAEWVFWVGAILFALRLVIQLLSLYKLYRDSEPGHVHNYPVRLIDGDVSPFSFWRSIYINPSKLSPADLEKVLEHEQVHVSEWHTLDILLAELSTVFYWFNPGIWLMKKAVKENIEFITDRKILQRGIDSKQYQYSLLNVSMAGSSNKLVNNFNISTIKKRIVMMNAKRSSRLNLGRYVFVAPAVIILLLVFSISKVGAAKNELYKLKKIAAKIDFLKNSSDPVTTDVVKTKAENIDRPNVSSDKMIYIIDGKQSLAFPGNMESIAILTPKDARTFFNIGDNKKNVAFVTTLNSAAGNAIKAKIESLITTRHISVYKIAPEIVEKINKQISDLNKNFGVTNINSADTIYSGKSKNGKRNMLLTSDNSVDSVMFILNGAKSSHEEVKAVDPGKVMSLDMLPADRAKQYIDFVIDKPEVLFVTTDDSEAGKKLKSRIDKDMGHGVLAKAKNMSLTGSGDIAPTAAARAEGLTYSSSAVTTASADAAPAANTATTVYSLSASDTAPEVAIAGTKVKKITGVKNKVYITSSPKIALKNSVKINPDKIYVSPKADQLITVDSNGVQHTNYIFKPNNKVYITRAMTTGDETTIDDFHKNVLYIVDGKEVKDLKKVSGDDIQSIRVLKDDKAREEYGDKGKNGVLIITTKKGKE